MPSGVGRGQNLGQKFLPCMDLVVIRGTCVSQTRLVVSKVGVIHTVALGHQTFVVSSHFW